MIPPVFFNDGGGAWVVILARCMLFVFHQQTVIGLIHLMLSLLRPSTSPWSHTPPVLANEAFQNGGSKGRGQISILVDFWGTEIVDNRDSRPLGTDFDFISRKLNASSSSSSSSTSPVLSVSSVRSNCSCWVCMCFRSLTWRVRAAIWWAISSNCWV